ncbi:MAG: hypothetical protein ACI38U_14280 [Corynebacterium sp.]|uniref:hypothetical protein n=1 Tax=Corynebacterium sp. TaxID=1720 RepID=UPI003F0C592D
MTTATLTKREDFPICEAFPALTGKQTPLNLREAPGEHEHGRKNIELARRSGVEPMPWQENEINAINATDPDGRWVHSDAILICPRQNGKSLIVALIVIYRIFVLGQNVLFTAQQWETAKELWEQTWKIVKGRRFLMKLHTAHTCSQGRGTIVLSNGGKVVFTTRSQDAGRGLTKVDLLIYDESYNLSESEMAALTFLSQAADDPQVFFMSSAVHQDFPQHKNGQVLSSMRAQALNEWEAEDPLYLAEYAAPEDMDPQAEITHRTANPSYGVIANAKKMHKIMRRMNTELGRRNFGVEALGWASWFDETDVDEHQPVISDDAVNEVMTSGPVTMGYTVLAIDAAPDRTAVSVSAGGRTKDGVHGIVGWRGDMSEPAVVAAVLSAVGDTTQAVLIDPKSAAAVFIDPLERAGLEITQMKWNQVSGSCSAFLQGIDDRQYTLSEDAKLRDEINVVTLREGKEGGVMWERYSGEVSGLTSVGMAMWGVQQFAPLPKKPRGAKTSVGIDADDSPVSAIQF